MKINEERVPHYQLKKVPIEQVSKMVSIDKNHLIEKDTWYLIDDKLCFFKVRSDYRIIGELLSADIHKALGMDSVDYNLAYINGKLGIISENFQVNGNNYYHVSDLYKSKISSIKAFGEYSFKSLYDYFGVKLEDEKLFKKIGTQLAELFISDYLTHQQDRNYKNIMFKMNVQGVNSNLGCIPSIHGRKIENVSLSKIFDSEKSFSIGRDGVYDYNLNKVWDTSFMAEPTTGVGFFEDDNLIDINLLSLYMYYPELTEDFMKKIVNDFNPQQILSKYQQSNSQLYIRSNNISYLDNLLTNKQEGIQRVLDI